MTLGIDTAVDTSCDHCGRTVSRLYLFPLPGNRTHLCAGCVVRESGHPICDYCERPTLGDYRRIERGKSISIACGTCFSKWQEEAAS